MCFGQTGIESQRLADGLAAATRPDSGQDLAEYAILTALIVLVVIGVLSLVGDQIAAFYESVVGVLPFSG